MRAIAFCFLALLSSACLSADRTDKVRELMEAQGLLQMFERQMQTGKAEARQREEQMLTQFTAQLKPTKECDTLFRAAFEDSRKALEAPWTAQDIVDVWANVFGSRFTDEELDQLLAFYTSPLGKKEVMASQQALPELTTHFFALSRPLTDRATKDFFQRVQLIAKESKCQK
jgi:hypothetical protein